MTKTFKVGDRVSIVAAFRTDQDAVYTITNMRYNDTTNCIYYYLNGTDPDSGMGWGAKQLQLVEPERYVDGEKVDSPKDVATPRRVELLENVKRIITKERNNTYGPPSQDFKRTAGILSALGFRFGTDELSAHHVALAMAALKLSRLSWSPDHEDNWVDLAGYAATGWEAFNENPPARH